MAASIPAKIVMKGTSKISLHDRFTKLGAPIDVKNDRPGQRTITMKAPQYIEQMERRPAVFAALYGDTEFAEQRSAFQRLGVKARLGNAYALNPVSYPPRFRRFYPYRRGWRNGFRGRFRSERNYSFADGDVDLPLSTLIENGYTQAWKRRAPYRPRFQNRGAFRQSRGNPGYFRGRSGPNFYSKRPHQRPTKEQLDRDLDDYLENSGKGKPKDEYDMDDLLRLL